MKQRVVALAGGTGSAKLLRGLAASGCDLQVVSNVGDNYWVHGLYVCPDIDIAMYSLAGLADRTRGWGIANDTFETLQQLSRLGEETWFSLGDADIATHLLRTELMKEGLSLTAATDVIRRKLGVVQRILPASDSPVATHVKTNRGRMHLQEFWVKNKGRPAVTEIEYRGASAAHPTWEVVAAIKQADRVVICPANPMTSISPILAISGMIPLLSGSKARVVALSPMKGPGPFSGPASKLMKAGKVRADSLGVARLYRKFLDAFIVDEEDRMLVEKISDLGTTCVVSDASLKSPEDERRLALELLEA